jgi:hypothetical protein
LAQEAIADDRALAEREETALQTDSLSRLTREQIELVKDTIARGATDTELAMFVEECNSLGLNPFAKEIYFLKYKSRDGNTSVAMPVGIDGRRKFADRHPLYRGQAGPFWCGQDGVWKDVWLEDGPPAAAKVGIYLEGYPEPTWGVATWKEFNKVGRVGDQFWRQSPAHMLAIRAESHALRKVAAQHPNPRQVVTTEFLLRQAENIARDQALPARTAPLSQESVRRQVFEDVDPETGEILDDDTVDGDCEPVEEAPPAARESVASLTPDWDRLKAEIIKRQLPVGFRDAFLKLAQSSGWSKVDTSAALLSWQKRYRKDPDQTLADLADMSKVPADEAKG